MPKSLRPVVPRGAGPTEDRVPDSYAGRSLRAVLFDMDGTIVEVPYDWADIRRRLGVGDASILNTLNGLEEPERSIKWALLEKIEAEATAAAVVKTGVKSLLRSLRANGLSTALVTNNSKRNTDALLARFGLRFDFVLSRDSGLWKPSAAPFQAALRALDVAASAACAVGDSILDVRAALDAQIERIFVLTGDAARFASWPVIIVASAAALKIRILELIDG